MTTLLPCNTCWFRTHGHCDLRESWRMSIKGIGLTTARFPCERQSIEYRPGRRVKARIQGGGSDHPDDEWRSPADVIVKATVLHKSSKRDRWVIWPDDSEHDRLPNVGSTLKICALRSFNLEPINEPDNPARVAELTAREAALAMKNEDF